MAAKKSNATRVGYAPNAIVPGCNHGRGLAWAFGEQEASRNVKSIAGGTNSNREDQSEIHSADAVTTDGEAAARTRLALWDQTRRLSDSRD